MKKLILSCMLVAISSYSFAQNHDHHYNRSVFYEVKPFFQKAGNDATAATRQKFAGWSVYTDPYSGNPADIYGKAIAINGNTLTEKAAYVIAHMLPDINLAEWTVVKEHRSTKADYVNYVRNISGHGVMFSRLSFRFAKDGKLVRVQIKSYGNDKMNNISIPASEAASSPALTHDLEGVNIQAKEVMKDWVWFPVPGSNGYTLHPAWHVRLNGKDESSMPVKLNCYVDATDGKLLYRHNEVKEAFDVTVKGNVYKQSILSPPTLEPLENLLVYPGFNTLQTNTSGVASSAAINVPVNTTFRLEGLWSIVNDDPTSSVPTFNQNITSLGTTYTMPAATRHVSAYYHVNRIHEVMKSYFPSFTDLDFPLATNVDITTNTCNAFYDGASINFLPAGGGCPSLAEVADVVYHEYGHGISDVYYQFMGSPFGLENGALHEANADVWAMGITNIPILGNGAFTSGGWFRRYDEEAKMYPRDIIEEVHGDGEIIAGIWWDVATNLGSIPDMMQLFTAVYNDVPNGPDGTEGDVYHQVLISALMNDDNDNNLANGTPHFQPIVKAFAKHGIYVLGEVMTSHADIPHQPVATPITVNAGIFIQDNALLQDVSLIYRNRSGGNWTGVVMANPTPGAYTAQIPAQTVTGIIDYYFQLRTLQGVSNGVLPLQFDTAVSRARYVTIPYQFAVNITANDSNKFEGAITGWTIGNAPGDNATQGKWIQAVPVASFTPNGTFLCQVDKDHTTGAGKCLVTGNAGSTGAPLGDNDVDNGKTTAITPVFDLSAYTEPMIEYYRWYADSKGGNAHNDAWVAKVGNSTTSNWVVVDSTFASDYHWRRRIFAVKDYLTSLSDVQMRFEVTDLIVPGLRNDGQSVTEGAVDDFFIYDKKPVGISDPNTWKADIYPNPADDKVIITISRNMEGSIRLCDLTGKAVRELQIDGSTSQYVMNTGQLVAGTYMLVVQTGSSVQTKKVVLKH